MNSRRCIVMLATGLGIAALAWPLLHPSSVHLVYNPTDSVPHGWYRIGPPDSLRVGSIVLTRIPTEASALAAQRGYLPERIPLLKRIGAVAPQRVCIVDRIVRIDGVAQGPALKADSHGRVLPIWQPCRALRAGELFLLSATNPASFDSRYFGPVTTADVIGGGEPLWTSEPP